jgi:hypothetical protein
MHGIFVFEETPGKKYAMISADFFTSSMGREIFN